MPNFTRLLFVFTIFFLGACSNEIVVENVMPDHVEKEVTRLLKATIEKDSSALVLHADDVLKDTAKWDKVLNTVVVGTELKSVDLHDYQQEMSASLRDGKSREYTVSYLIETDMRLFLVEYELHESSEGLTLYDVSVQPARKRK